LPGQQPRRTSFILLDRTQVPMESVSSPFSATGSAGALAGKDTATGTRSARQDGSVPEADPRACPSSPGADGSWWSILHGFAPGSLLLHFFLRGSPALRPSQHRLDQTAVLRSVDGERSYRRRLLELGFVPGTELRLVRRVGVGDVLEVELRHSRVSLRISEARRIEVEARGEGTSLIGEENTV